MSIGRRIREFGGRREEVARLDSSQMQVDQKVAHGAKLWIVMIGIYLESNPRLVRFTKDFEYENVDTVLLNFEHPGNKLRHVDVMELVVTQEELDGK
jgi:hypothetical protein